MLLCAERAGELVYGISLSLSLSLSFARSLELTAIYR